METQCVPCGKVLSSPTAAAKHVLRHPPVARNAKTAGWESEPYRNGQSWGDFAQSTPRPTLAGRAKSGGVSAAAPRTSAAATGKVTPRLSRSQAQERQRLLNLVWPHRPHPTICAWCGQNVTRETASVHHLLPRDKGGTDDLRNLALVHLGECHDRLELWTKETGRSPSGDEWGQLDQLWGNVLTIGYGTRPQEREPVKAISLLTTDDVPRYLDYLKRIDQQYATEIARDPDWGTWVYREPEAEAVA